MYRLGQAQESWPLRLLLQQKVPLLGTYSFISQPALCALGPSSHCCLLGAMQQAPTVWSQI